MTTHYYLDQLFCNLWRAVRKLQFVPSTYSFVKFRSAFLLFASFAVAASCTAASLGRHSGAALVGRPLDISVQAVLNAQDDIANLCLDADVFYADNRLDKSRVRITAEKTSAGSQDAVIRIRATVPVDEPVVTIYVRVGCQQKIERRYVTLADMPSEAVTDRNAASFGRSPSQGFPQASTSPGLAPENSDLADSKTVQNTRNTRNRRAAQGSQKPADGDTSVALTESAGLNGAQNRQTKVAVKPVRPGLASATDKLAVPSGSRLKLESIDLIEREPQLRLSSQLLSTPSSSPQERTAAAALWRAIAMQPQDLVRDFEKLQNLESSARTFQAQNQKTQQSIQELGVKLQKAESERYANALVYALGLLLFVAIAGLAYVLQKQSLQSRAGGGLPWWRKRDNPQGLRKNWTDSGAHSDDLDSNRESAGKKHKSTAAANAGFANPEINLDALNAPSKPSKLELDFNTDSVPPLASSFQADFALSMTHPSRAVKAEELLDVNQQADFFVSIGQHEQAIEVLRNHIDDDVETSVLVYLDLFNLYHQLARKKDYAVLREDFNGRFNTKIPVFELYTVAGPGLEAYQLAMSRIEALWPSPKVLEVIEDSIFKRPENDAEAFNLEAYRELLMLYSVAKEIINFDNKAAVRPSEAKKVDKFSERKKFDLPATSADSTDLRPAAFVPTSIQPLSANIQENDGAVSARPAQPLLSLTVPPAFLGLSLGLDLDLSEPISPAEKRIPKTASNALSTDFSARVAKDAVDSLPLVDTTAGGQGSAQSTGNMIAFDGFDAFDKSLSASKNRKPPAPEV